MKALGDAAYPVRENAARAFLGVKRPGDAALEALARRLKDPVPAVRNHAVAAACRDGKIRFWTLPDRKLTVLEGIAGHVNRIAVSPDGRTLFAGTRAGSLVLRDLDRKKTVGRVDGHTLPIHVLAASGDGRILATGSYNVVGLWNAASGRLESRLETGHDCVLGLALDRTGCRIAASNEGDRRAGKKDTLWLWTRTEDGFNNPVRIELEAPFRCLAFTPDGSTLLATTDDRAIHVLDATTGTARAKLTGHTAAAWSLDLHPDGNTLASASWDGTIRLWDLSAQKEIACLHGHESDVHAVRFLPGGARLVSAGYDFTVRLWDVAKKRTIHVFRHEPLPGTEPYPWLKERRWTRRRTVRTSPRVAVHPDGRLIACTGWDDAVRILDAKTFRLKAVVPAHRNGIHGLAFTPDHGLATAGNDSTVCVFDASTLAGGSGVLRGHRGGVKAVAYSPDGQTLAAGDASGEIRLWNLASGACRELRDHGEKPVQVVAFRPDGNEVVTGDAAGVLRRYSVAAGAIEEIQGGFEGGIKTLAYSADGKQLVVAPFDRPVEILDAGSFRVRRRFHWGTKNANSLALRPDGGLLVVGGSHFNSVQVRDLVKDKSLGLPGHGHAVYAVAFSADGRWLATGGFDGKIRLYGGTDLDERGVLEGHEGSVNDLAFSPDGKKLASLGHDRTLRLWSLAQGTCAATHRSMNDYPDAIAYHPDGCEVAIGVQDGTILRWRVPRAGLAGEPPDKILSDLEKATHLVLRGGRIEFAPPAADFTAIAPHRFETAAGFRRRIQWVDRTRPAGR